MKLRLTTVVLLVVLGLSVPLDAAPAKGAGKGAAAGKKKNAAAQAASPAAELEPFITRLDGLLALDRPKGPFYQQAGGKLALMRQDFHTRGNAAPDAEKPKYSAAIVTVDKITAALDERQKTLGNVKSSAAVEGTSKLDQGPRKDNASQGIKGRLARAVGEVQERKRENTANRKAQRAAASRDDSLTAMSENHWNKRSIELRQGIIDAYSKVK